MAERALAIAPPEVWISFEQLLAATGWNRRWAFEQSANSAITSRPSFTKSANGKAQREYLLSSLPESAQHKYAARRFSAALTGPGLSAAPLFAAAEARENENRPGRAEIAEADRPLADARYAAIEPLLNWDGTQIATTRDGRKIATSEDLAAYLGAQVPAQHGGPSSKTTVFRWLRQFRQARKLGENPYAALCDRTRSDQGHSRFFAEHPAALAFVHQKRGNERVATGTVIYEALLAKWPELLQLDRRPSGRTSQEWEKPPAYSTVAAHLSTLPRAMLTLADKGPRAFRFQHMAPIQRQRVEPMEWWVLDHRELDIMGRNAMFSELAPNAAWRPWVTAIVDMATGCWMGYCFSPLPSWRTVGSALRMAIGEYGFPANYYWDNGEDFKKAQRMIEGHDLGEEFGVRVQQMLRAESCNFRELPRVTRARPYNAQAKMIEAKFSGMSKRFDPLYAETGAYRGRNSQHRSEYAALAEKEHKKFLAGKLSESPLPLDAEIVAGCIAWMHRENNRPRKSFGDRSPAQLLADMCPTPLRPAGKGLLNMLFAERDRRQVRRGGCIQLEKRTYEPCDEWLAPMSDREGHEVIVLRDPYALEDAVAIDPQNMELAGELRLQEFIAQCPGGHLVRDQIRAHERRGAALLKRWRNYFSYCSAISANAGWKSEREVLLESAGFAPDISRATPGAGTPRQIAGTPALPPAPQSPEDFIESFSEEN